MSKYKPKTPQHSFYSHQITITSLALLVVNIWLQAMIPVAVYGANLIKNSGFELAGIRGIAQQWRDNSGWADVNVSYTRIYNKIRHGYVQRIKCKRFGRGAVQFIQPGLTLKAGANYRIGLWVKGNTASPFEILLRKHGKPYTTYFSHAFTAPEKWTHLSFIAPINTSDPSAYFMVRFTSRGELLLDDITVTDITASVDVDVVPVKKGNLLRNGSFEIGTDGWGTSIRATNPGQEMAVRARELRAVADPKHYKYGQYALKIPGNRNSRFLLTSAAIRLSPKHAYTLSLWTYSQTHRRLTIAIRSGYFGHAREHRKTITLGPEWSKHTLTTTLSPASDNAYFIAVEGSGDGPVWIDDVQLVAGSHTQYQETKISEIGFLKEHLHPIFVVNEHISIPLRIRLDTTTKNCKLVVTSTDYYGIKSILMKQSCPITQLRPVNINVTIPSDRTGYYKLTADVLLGGKMIDTTEYAIGIVPSLSDRISDRQSPFGAHSRFTQSDLATAWKLGVKWLRMHPPLGTKWAIVERVKGRFVFRDQEIMNAVNKGFNILGSLDRTPRWDSSAPDNARRYWAYVPRDLDAWEHYVYKIVKHYAGIIDDWEVWNEPDSDGFFRVPGVLGTARKPALYVELLKRAYRAAKRANPNVRIIGGVSSGQPPYRWLGNIFKLGALNNMDIVSFHFYTDGRPGDALDTPVDHDVNVIRRLMKQYADKTIPIWETESGIMQTRTNYTNLIEIDPGFSVSPKDAVAYLIRNYVTLLSSGVKKWFYYSMATSNRIDRKEATGFFEWDGSPRPLAIAYAVLAHNLGSMRYTGSDASYPNVNVYRFTGRKKTLRILWAKGWGSEANQSISIHLDQDDVSPEIIDVMGNAIPYQMNGQVMSFHVSQQPVYLLSGSSNP